MICKDSSFEKNHVSAGEDIDFVFVANSKDIN